MNRELHTLKSPEFLHYTLVMNSLVTYNQFRGVARTDNVLSLGMQSCPCVPANFTDFHQNRQSMDIERIRKLEESVLALQKETSVPKPKDLDSDILTRLGNLEASVIQERAQKGELRQKLKFANNQNSRLLLRLKKEKARSSLLNHRMRGAKLPRTPEGIPIPDPLLQADRRISKSLNDIPQGSFGIQGRHALDSSDSLSFTDEDSLPRVVHSQIPQRRNKDEFNQEGRVETSEMSRPVTGAQRIGARMSGEQALQLLSNYQQTIIQQQQESRDLQMKIRSTEQNHSNLIQATQDGRRLVEYLTVIAEREKQIEFLKQKSRELQIGMMELENEKNDAVYLAKDLSLQLTRAKLAKDAALRTSRQLMEQFPTRPPREQRDETSESSLPSTPSNQSEYIPKSAPPSVSGDNQSRYLPQPPSKQTRAAIPKIIVTDPTESTSPAIPSPTYDSSGGLPKSVLLFKRSVQSQKQSEMLPSKLVIKNKSSGKASPNSSSAGTKLIKSVFRSKRDPASPSNATDDGMSHGPLHESPLMTSSVPVDRDAEIHRLRSDSEPEPSTPGANSIEIICETPTSTLNSQYQPQKDTSAHDSMGKRAISMSTLASGLGFKGKHKEKSVKSKKGKSVEDPVKAGGATKVHKRFSSLNSLPNAFKRSPKLEEKKRKEVPGIPTSNKKEKHKCRMSDDGLEIEFKHISDIPATNTHQDSSAKTARVSDKFRLSLASLPISEISETASPSEEFHSLVRSKKLGDINTIANLSSQSSPPWNS